MGAKKRTWNENAAIRSALRRVFSRSPVVLEVLNEGKRRVPRFNKDGSRHKVDSVQYSCQKCGVWVGRDAVEVDHVEPVIPRDKTFEDISLDEFKTRLFCTKTNLQRLCDDCHQAKTIAERATRSRTKDLATLVELEAGVTYAKTTSELKELKKHTKKYAGGKKHEDVQTAAKALLKKIASLLLKD